MNHLFSRAVSAFQIAHAGLRIVASACLIAAIGATSANASQSVPNQIKASYKIYKSGILIGTVEEQFSREGDTYRIVSTTQTAGALSWVLRDSVSLKSEGRVTARGMEPVQYEMKRQGDSRKDIHAQFDWAKGQIISDHENKTENFDLPVGTLDRIASMYQFMFSPPVSNEVATWMTQGKKAERYLYQKMGEPLVKIGDREYPTVHYVRETKAGESKAQLWLGTQQNYVPVRIIFEDSRGLSLEQSLVNIQVQ